VLVIVMAALGTAAPLGSVTVPRRVASWAKACVAKITKKAARRIASREPQRFMAGLNLPTNVGERDFI
jgi:hypothetical protein